MMNDLKDKKKNGEEDYSSHWLQAPKLSKENEERLEAYFKKHPVHITIRPRKGKN